MNTQDLRIHALRRLHELAEAKGYQYYFSLDEIAAEVGIDDQMKVLGLGQDLEADGLVTLISAHDGTSAAIKTRGVKVAEEALASPKPKRVPAKPAEAHLSEGMPGSMKVFISYSTKDEGVAKCLLALLRSALNIPPAEIRCASVDGHRLEVGAETGSQLRREITEAGSLIGIISPSSMRSAWVLFELGARWGAGKTLAPVLAPGSPSDLLQGPLAELNALSCSKPAQLHQLVRDIGRRLGITPNSPDSYQDQIDAFASIQTQQPENLDRATDLEVLSSSDLVVLFRQSLLARLRDEGELTLDLRREAETANLPTAALKAEIHKLADRGKVDIVDEGTEVMVVREPPRYLEGHLLD